jgi:hypothetical protein
MKIQIGRAWDKNWLLRDDDKPCVSFDTIEEILAEVKRICEREYPETKNEVGTKSHRETAL